MKKNKSTRFISIDSPITFLLSLFSLSYCLSYLFKDGKKKIHIQHTYVISRKRGQIFWLLFYIFLSPLLSRGKKLNTRVTKPLRPDLS